LLVEPEENIEEGDTTMNGSITLRKDGRFMGRVYIKHKQICVYGKTRKEAELKLKELKKKNSKLETNYFKMTLFQFAKEYCENFKKPLMKESSYRQTYYKVVRWEKSKIFTKKIVNVSHFDLVEFFKNEDKKYLSYLILKETFDKAKEIGIVDINPMALICKPSQDTISDRVKSIDSKSMIYSAENIKQIEAELIGSDEWYIFKTLLCTGIRIGEALALQVKDFDFEKKTLRVYKNYDYIADSITTTKTKKGTRLVPLFDELINTIQPYLASKDLDDIAFNFGYMQLEYLCKALTKKLGFKVGLHKFRKTFISICQFQLGISTSVVAQWVGHANTTTTQDFYSFLTDIENKQLASGKKIFDT